MLVAFTFGRIDPAIRLSAENQTYDGARCAKTRSDREGSVDVRSADETDCVRPM